MRHATPPLLIAISALLLSACTTSPRTGGPRSTLGASGVLGIPAPGAVAMPDEHSAQVAAAVLARGGNAVDAAVASAFALAVTYPEAGNIGGGGFMLIWMRGEPTFLDYREVAPAAAHRDMYLNDRGEVIEGASLTGPLAAGVPGAVAGLHAAHQRYGALPWADLVQPAIDLAEHGFTVHPALEAATRKERRRFQGRTNFDAYFSRVRAGERFRQPELADTLRRIRDEGPRDFYNGRTAALIADKMQRAGGIITRADLASYTPVWREPLTGLWRGSTLLLAPPPSSGGLAVLQLLAMREALAEEFDALQHNSPQYLHLTAEMLKRVFADRAAYLADPAFTGVPVERLTDPSYTAQRASQVDPQRISPVAAVPPGLEPADTTHFSIIDRDGNAVANTYTLNTSFGSGVVVRGAGFLLNNQMDDFSLKPGVPNYYGVVGGETNAVEPGKRMLSSMAPTIILDSTGRPWMVLGTPGGSTIISTVYQVIINIAHFAMTPAQAADATRIHHQLPPPDLITHSPSRPLPEQTAEALRARGYRVEPHPWEFGDVQILLRTPDGWIGASDPRGRGVTTGVQ